MRMNYRRYVSWFIFIFSFPNEFLSAPELLRRETSRRKAKDNLKAKIEAQEKLLLDQDDPTFNNPALDLDDSDDDAEWNPLKEAEKSGNKRKRGGDSSDEDEEDYSEFNNLHNVNNKSRVKKRSHHDNRKHSTHSENDNNVPEGEDFKVMQSAECHLYTSNLYFPSRSDNSWF